MDAYGLQKSPLSNLQSFPDDQQTDQDKPRKLPLKLRVTSSLEQYLGIYIKASLLILAISILSF